LKKNPKDSWPDVGVIKDDAKFEDKSNKIVFFEDELFEKEKNKL